MQQSRKWISGLFVSCLLFSISCDPCRDTTCHQGTVKEQNDECICECQDGYEGETCNQTVNEKFQGDYMVEDSCASGRFNYGVGIRTSGKTTIFIDTFAGFPEMTVESTISNKDQLTIPQQTSGGYDIEGEGQMLDQQEKVQVRYTIKGNGIDDTCDALYTPR